MLPNPNPTQNITFSALFVNNPPKPDVFDFKTQIS